MKAYFSLGSPSHMIHGPQDMDSCESSFSGRQCQQICAGDWESELGRKRSQRCSVHQVTPEGNQSLHSWGVLRASVGHMLQSFLSWGVPGNHNMYTYPLHHWGRAAEEWGSGEFHKCPIIWQVCKGSFGSGRDVRQSKCWQLEGKGVRNKNWGEGCWRCLLQS